jgi:hypothetical protein
MTLSRCLAALGLAACLALPAPPAQASFLGDAGRFVKKTTKKVGHAAGGVVKDVGRATGKAAKATGKAVGGVATGAVHTAGKGVKTVGRAGEKVLVKAANTPVIGSAVDTTYRLGRAVKEEITGEGPKERRAYNREHRRWKCEDEAAKSYRSSAGC